MELYSESYSDLQWKRIWKCAPEPNIVLQTNYSLMNKKRMH